MKVVVAIIAMILWVGLVIYLFLLSKRKSKGNAVIETGQRSATAKTFEGFQIVKGNGVITINISPDFFNKTIQLKMDNDNRELTMQVISDENNSKEDVTPMADISEEEIMTPTDVINEFIAGDSRVNEVLIAQLEELAKDGKVEFSEPTDIE